MHSFSNDKLIFQRKSALVKERVRRNRTGGVIDRRFGEDDPNMDPEEKMLERFAREKQVKRMF
jgi:nucleolar protein 14